MDGTLDKIIFCNISTLGRSQEHPFGWVVSVQRGLFQIWVTNHSHSDLKYYNGPENHSCPESHSPLGVISNPGDYDFHYRPENQSCPDLKNHSRPYLKNNKYRISANSFRGNYSREETIRGNTVVRKVLC